MGDSLALSVVDRRKIEEWISAHGTPRQIALRCRIVLGAAEGETDSASARRLAVNRNTVILWRKRFIEFGLDGLWDIAQGQRDESRPTSWTRSRPSSMQPFKPNRRG